MEVGAWQRLSDCLATLALRNAALETLLEVSAAIGASQLLCSEKPRGAALLTVGARFSTCSSCPSFHSETCRLLQECYAPCSGAL